MAYLYNAFKYPLQYVMGIGDSYRTVIVVTVSRAAASTMNFIS